MLGSGDSRSSVGVRHAVENIAVAAYNIGINNVEFESNTKKFKLKTVTLIKEINAIFNHTIGVSLLMISEVGNMFTRLDKQDVEEFFRHIFNSIHVKTIEVLYALPFIALVHTRYWSVVEHIRSEFLGLVELKGNPSSGKPFVHAVTLRSKSTSKLLRCFNGHIPISIKNTPGSKQKTVVGILNICTRHIVDDHTPQWIICGDFNTSPAVFAAWCASYETNSRATISYTGHEPQPLIGGWTNQDARKADFECQAGSTSRSKGPSSEYTIDHVHQMLMIA
jgi:hypothetical protein